jgi:predicted nucleic acid-binding Zn ribbon protein
MPRKTVGFVQLGWSCPNCSQMNPGPQKTCTACGSPQPDNVQFENMPQQELITDEAVKEKARKGADINCPYCGTRNPADAALCSQCGGDLKGGKQRQSGAVVGAFNNAPVGQKPCPTCGTPNPANNTRCSSCGASMSQPAGQTPALASQAPGAPLPPAPPKKRSPLLMIGLAALLCLVGVVCIALIVFLTRTKEITGTVTGLAWERSINIEQIQPVSRSDWRESIPADASIGNCEQKVNHTQDQPEGNYQEVCGTPYTVDTGTGIGEVVQDCQYEIYMDYCEYTVQEWTVVNTSKQTGQDTNPFWPDPALAAGQRQGARTETFTAYFNTGKGTLNYSTPDLAIFQTFQPGSVWLLDVNTFGAIVDLRPK